MLIYVPYVKGWALLFLMWNLFVVPLTFSRNAVGTIC